MGAVRFQRQDNPLYPLPPDYNSLSVEGQRQARLNALRLQDTPDDLVHAWAFFRHYYLEPKEAGWYKRWKPSPPAHYMMIRDLGQYSANVYLAPRAFAKSTLLDEVGGLLLPLTRPDFYTALLKATGKKVRKSMRRLVRQLGRNRRLNDDFKPEFGEFLKPKRGARPWGVDLYELPHGSMVEGLSAQGALRGDRPDLLVPDDPEYDDEEGSDVTRVMEDFETLLFATLLPMLEEGCPLFWIGTAIPRSYIYYIVTGDDPRFQYFNRKRLTIYAPDGSPLWEAKWDGQTVEDLRARLGESKFQQEYMNNPTSGADRVLVLHPKLGVYRVTGGSPEKEDDPFQSHAVIRWYERSADESSDRSDRSDRYDHCGRYDHYIEEHRPFGEWVSTLYRLITVDFIRRPSSTSDFACAQVMGFDRKDVLWLLDSYLARVGTTKLIEVVWRLAQRWRVRLIGAEAIAFQSQFVDQMAARIAMLAAGSRIVPRVVPIKYAKRGLYNTDAPTQIDKGERIAGMEWRFQQHRIRFPEHRRREFPIAQLFYQTEQFTRDLSLLRHDDAIDTLAMHQYVVRRQGVSRARGPRVIRPLEALKNGQLFDAELGTPLILAIPPEKVTPDLYREVRQKQYELAGVPSEPPEISLWSSLPMSMSWCS